MKKFLLSLFCLGSAAGLWAQTQLVEVDGVFYRPGPYYASIQNRPDREPYAGEIYLPNEITIPDTGVTNFVNQSTSCFQKCEVTSMTLGWVPEENRHMSLDMRDVPTLERLQIMHLREPGNVLFNEISLGNDTKCVEVFLRTIGDKRQVIVNTFNVFGPDGEQLQPKLCIEATGQMIDPVDGATFELDADWRYNGEYCGVMPLSPAFGYTVVYLFGVDAEGNYASLRCTPPPTQSGWYVETEGCKIAIDGTTATFVAPAGEDVKDIVIPAEVYDQGAVYPVTSIANEAFVRSDIESVVIPGTIEGIGRYAFEYCENLRSVDMTQCGPLELEFTFYNCTALEEIRVPEGCKLSDAFQGCTGLYDIEVVADDEQTYAFRLTHFNIFDIDGNPLPVEFRTDISSMYKENVYAELNDGVYTFNRQDFYYTNSSGDKWYDGDIVAEFPSAQSRAEDYLAPGSIYFELRTPEYTGVAEIAVPEQQGAEQWYNLQGQQVRRDNLTPGIYVKRQGGKCSKVVVR